MRINIGDNVLCKVDNKEYWIEDVITDWFNTDTQSDTRIFVKNEVNSFMVDVETFEKMFEYNKWSEWWNKTIYYNGRYYGTYYRYNNECFEMCLSDTTPYGFGVVRAKLHPKDNFNFNKGLEVVELRMKQKMMRKDLEKINKQLKKY